LAAFWQSHISRETVSAPDVPGTARDCQQLAYVYFEDEPGGDRLPSCCTANLKCKSLLFIAGLATKSANDLNFTKALARSYAGSHSTISRLHG
jgi:hypothetical protein